MGVEITTIIGSLRKYTLDDGMSIYAGNVVTSHFEN